MVRDVTVCIGDVVWPEEEEEEEEVEEEGVAL
jgi:hypothetical protein